MTYIAKEDRYESMKFNHCGKWGLKLPAISLGLWHNFGDIDSFSTGLEMIKVAFDLGITHFDLANNYGTPGGSAEKFMGRVFENELKSYRDELIISTKAGYKMWDGPYGDGGSRKYLLSSLDQSLRRMNLDYVDIFYHHRPDKETPIEESMMALHQAVVSGKALYVGLSNYGAEDAKIAIDILKSLGTPCLIHQVRYSMMDREPEKELYNVLNKEGVGAITFSPLKKGILTDKYLQGIPDGSRAAGPSIFLKESDITDEVIEKVKKLKVIANERNQSMAQLALAWNLRNKEVSSVLIGASRSAQIVDCVDSINNLDFTNEELESINKILVQ